MFSYYILAIEPKYSLHAPIHCTKYEYNWAKDLSITIKKISTLHKDVHNYPILVH